MRPKPKLKPGRTRLVLRSINTKNCERYCHYRASSGIQNWVHSSRQACSIPVTPFKQPTITHVNSMRQMSKQDKGAETDTETQTQAQGHTETKTHRHRRTERGGEDDEEAEDLHSELSSTLQKPAMGVAVAQHAWQPLAEETPLPDDGTSEAEEEDDDAAEPQTHK